MEFERFGSFLRYIGYFTQKAENVGAFAKWRQTKLSNVLSQDNYSQLLPEGQLGRSSTLGTVPAPRRGTHESNEGKIGQEDDTPNQPVTTDISFY